MRTDIVFGSTKTYKANVGLSTTFRQWRAKSHCNQLHGYALEFSATFEADALDQNHWVLDFGALKSFKQWLENMFDHTTLVAKDDPAKNWLETGEALGYLDLRQVDNCGCEAMALLVFDELRVWLTTNGHAPRVRLVKLEVREHDGNSAYVRLNNSRS
jgi:6-pyruvoyltetrahydropterin/6-carboxytetrahydropterin synthase